MPWVELASNSVSSASFQFDGSTHGSVSTCCFNGPAEQSSGFVKNASPLPLPSRSEGSPKNITCAPTILIVCVRGIYGEDTLNTYPCSDGNNRGNNVTTVSTNSNANSAG